MRDLNAEFEGRVGGEGLRTIAEWIASNSLWVDPRVVREVQVVHPRTRRGPQASKRSIVDGVAIWANEPASSAIWRALGARVQQHGPSDIKNGRVCHIYEGSVASPQHFTHLANMTVVPRALESFTEWPPIGKLLKWKSFELYDYRGPEQAVPEKPEFIPMAWPGVGVLSDAAAADVIATLRKRSETLPYYYAKQPTAED